jgi:predicted DNA-binding transcriptional regulator AlpA
MSTWKPRAHMRMLTSFNATTNNPINCLYTLTGVCNKFNISRHTLYRWRRDPKRNFPKPIEKWKNDETNYIYWRAIDIEEYYKKINTQLSFNFER